MATDIDVCVCLFLVVRWLACTSAPDATPDANPSITEKEIWGLALFALHEKIAPEDVRLQMGEKFYDGREFDESTVCRILEKLVQVD
jgi:hypothetical protein